MHPAASNAHLKALRLNLVGQLAPGRIRGFGVLEKAKDGRDIDHPCGFSKSWPSSSSVDLLFSFALTPRGDGFLHQNPLC